ncbi:MAG: AAA family ATPase [Candidatus Nomurabacteria bacterium]|nr:AAA family ATPase [Candidatus Nomurabacteria bacterium]MCX6788432.1 AAA family ATPase [Candidatus Jorgensenbacteria bacterium]
MDKGTHFYKCDFQVHTPRDANWVGTEATTQAERKTYAEELIQSCRIKGIGAIAITDHHDFTFFPYVKAASVSEVDAVGSPIPKRDQIVVFPGIELTLSSPPCQAILLLDSEFDETKFGDILTTLTIAPTDKVKSKLASVDSVSPASITGFNDLENKLNQHAWLKGKFIILPNVTTAGHKTLFRDGYAKHYKEMRCVGGYVDGDYSKSSDGYKNILEGRQQNNGYKSIAVFQTSDNRKRDHSDLGTYITYVKWSEPTAEALRQACLAKESRLSLAEPELPSVWITSVTVSNSKFLGRVDLDLNQQYNAIIGGRGTGKSTILEYLRWGLCDQPIESEDMDIVQNKRKNLIDNTLQKFDGEVHVEFLLNDVNHIVKRNSKKQEILLKIADGDFAPATEQQVRNLLPIQAYSQKQLSSVGVRIDELKRFVELPIKQELDQIRSDVRDNAAKMRSSYGDLIRMSEIETEVEKNNVEIASVTEQLDKLRKSLKGLSKEDQKTINQKAKYDEEETIIGDLQNELSTAQGSVESLEAEFYKDVATQEEEAELENTAIIKDIKKKFASKFVEIKAGVGALSSLFKPASLKDINDAIKAWNKLKVAFDKKYEAAKVKAKVNQQQLDQIQIHEKRIGILKKQQTDKRNAITALGNPEATYKGLRTKWDTLHNLKVVAIEKQCEQFTALSGGLIKAEIKNSLDVDGFTQQLKTAFSGMNIKEDKIEKICKILLEATDPFTEWNNILSELRSLALYSDEGNDALPETPILNGKCFFINTELKRIATQFDSARWINLSMAELEFNPKFHYCTNKTKDEYIEFSDASAGQQATALLTVLLNQPGAPLIIDQPEDDIDSKMIKEIIERVWKAKSKRQLIFASHSANFVVNGDAELVVCCDYVKAGDQTHGVIKAIGAIDNAIIKEEITLVTEGGRQAFKLRMDKYGF